MLLKQGSTGSTVKNCQYTLHMLTYNVNGFDGSFGPGMVSAVRLYQSNNGLTINGNIDDATWNSMVASITPIKQYLRAKGVYLVSSFYGVGDSTLYDAVCSFQRSNGLSADGMVGPATRVKLFSNGSGNTVVGDNEFPMVFGDSGDKVLYLQYGLHILGCAPGAIDGSFGPAVDTAVRWFQNKYGLTPDGSVGNATWNKMKTLIKEIQQRLFDLRFDISIVNGIAGLETYDAVCAFQKSKGLSVDGSVGPTTRAILFGGSSSGTTANDDLPLFIGKTGKNVEAFQYGLHICGFNPNGFDGSFGPGMQAAVRNFQTSYGLTSDGSVGPATWDKMKFIILPIQQALKTLGWYTMDVDGIASIFTYNAVRGFQSSYVTLTVDGMVGPETRQLLGLSSSGASTGTGTVSSVLTQGSNGSLVRYLQQILNTLGYSLNVDGSYGPSMYSQIIRFQSDHGLTADGSFGPASWQTLFTYYAIPSSALGTALYGDRVAKAAEYELSLGFSEDNANDITPYGEWYGMNGQPWCAMFVSWCAHQAGYLGSEIPKYAYCPYGKTWYVNNGRYHARSSSYIPKRGDVVFFWSGTEISHTGLVVSSTLSTVTTIEGNASRMVKKCTYDLTNAYLDGYGTFSSTFIPPLTDTEERNGATDAFKDLIDSLGLSISGPRLDTEYTVNAGIFTIKIKAACGTSLVKSAQDKGYGTLTVSDGSISFQKNTTQEEIIVNTNLVDMFAAIQVDGIGSVPNLIFKIGIIINDGSIYFFSKPTPETMTFGMVFQRSTLVRDNLKITSSYSIEISMNSGLYAMAFESAKAKYIVDNNLVAFPWTLEEILLAGLFAIIIIGVVIVIPEAIAVAPTLVPVFSEYFKTFEYAFR